MKMTPEGGAKNMTRLDGDGQSGGDMIDKYNFLHSKKGGLANDAQGGIDEDEEREDPCGGAAFEQDLEISRVEVVEQGRQPSELLRTVLKVEIGLDRRRGFGSWRRGRDPLLDLVSCHVGVCTLGSMRESKWRRDDARQGSDMPDVEKESVEMLRCRLVPDIKDGLSWWSNR